MIDYLNTTLGAMFFLGIAIFIGIQVGYVVGMFLYSLVKLIKLGIRGVRK